MRRATPGVEGRRLTTPGAAQVRPAIRSGPGAEQRTGPRCPRGAAAHGGPAQRGVAPGRRDPAAAIGRRRRRYGGRRRRPRPVASDVAGHPARRHDRARGRARRCRAADRATPQRDPAALGHLRRHGVGRPPARPGHGADRRRGVRRPGAARARGRRTARAPGTRSPCCGRCWCCWPCCWCRSATGSGCGRCWSARRWSSSSPGLLPGQAQSAFAYLLAWFLLLSAPRPVLELQAERRRRRSPPPTRTSWPGSPDCRAWCGWGSSSPSPSAPWSQGGRWLLGGLA